MANRTRNIVLRVPVTAGERAMIERKMQQMGTGCFSVYARKMLISCLRLIILGNASDLRNVIQCSSKECILRALLF